MCRNLLLFMLKILPLTRVPVLVRKVYDAFSIEGYFIDILIGPDQSVAGLTCTSV